MNRLHAYIFFALLLLELPLAAQSADYTHGRHAIRLGWGDAFLSDMSDRLSVANIVPSENDDYLDCLLGVPAPIAHEYLTNYRMALDNSHKISSIGHFFLAYRFQVTPLIGIGVEADIIASNDRFHMVNGYRTIVDKHAKNQLIHFTLMPTVRFSYYRQRIVELYSALGVGYTFSKFTSAIPIVWGMGFEHDTQGVALSATLFGVNVGNEHWFAEVELGSMCTFPLFWPEVTYGAIYSSRLFSVAVGYRF
jgi:hypothetical protein